MSVLVDIVHPAHVHFYKHIIWELQRQGVATTIVARDKDVTCQLLDNYGFSYRRVGKSGKKNLFWQAEELVTRDLALAKIARTTGARVILTRNPAGVQVARLLRLRGIFDTDDGPAAGLHYRAAAPFAHAVTTPDCMRANLGKKQVRYPGYKQTAYLHPNHFRPNPGVLAHLGVAPGERYFVVRFVAMVASHDGGESGLPQATREEVVKRLLRLGKVFISSEGPLPTEFAQHRFAPPPELLHDALAYASLLVGDSQTMAAEAAVLGTPNLRVSSWKGRLDYLDELENSYGITESFLPREQARFFDRLETYAQHPDPRALIREGHRRMLADKCDVAEWYTRFVLENLCLPEPPPARDLGDLGASRA